MKTFILTLTLIFSGVSAFAQSRCFIEGPYSLDLFPQNNPSWLRGNVGTTRIELNVHNLFNDGRQMEATGWIRDQYVRLSIDSNGPNQLIRGFVRNDTVMWHGLNGHFSGLQTCIR